MKLKDTAGIPGAQSSYMNKIVTPVIENYLNYLLKPSVYLIKCTARDFLATDVFEQECLRRRIAQVNSLLLDPILAFWLLWTILKVRLVSSLG